MKSMLQFLELCGWFFFWVASQKTILTDLLTKDAISFHHYSQHPVWVVNMGTTGILAKAERSDSLFINLPLRLFLLTALVYSE
jgi:hypothetical protein